MARLRKISPGCKNCYVFYLDAKRGADTQNVSKNVSNFDYPLKKNRAGEYKVPSGVQLATCFTSDFFIDKADEWRKDAWDIVRLRPDVEFFIPTKRISRFSDCVPSDWRDGWDNVIIAVSAENAQAAKERIPLLQQARIKHKSFIMSPLLEAVDITSYLSSGDIELVSVGGESYENARECSFDWVLDLKKQCDSFGVPFDFHQTGTNFVYNGRRYLIPHHKEYGQAKKAFQRDRS